MLVRHGSLLSDNHLTLLHGGHEFFPELIRQIDQAASDIYFETYIFHPDEVGMQIIKALKNAVMRGVEVHVIVDWIGTGIRICHRLKAEFAAAGIHFRVYNPWFRRGLARQHRKLCVIDHARAFVGGINVIDDYRYDYFKKSKRLDAPRWDFAVLVEGPVLNLIQEEAESFWERAGPMPIKRRLRQYRTSFNRRVALAKVALAGFVVRDNFRNRRTIKRAYLRAIGRARHEIVMATPYFAPSRKFRRALYEAANRGVKITLLIGIGEFAWHDAVAKSLFPKFLKTGIRLFEYRKSQLHGKVAVIDDIWATVGSSNCDGVSLFINHEANVIVRDRAFAQTLKSHVMDALLDAEEIHLAEFRNMPWYKRWTYGAAHVIYRFVLRTATGGDYN